MSNLFYSNISSDGKISNISKFPVKLIPGGFSSVFQFDIESFSNNNKSLYVLGYEHPNSASIIKFNETGEIQVKNELFISDTTDLWYIDPSSQQSKGDKILIKRIILKENKSQLDILDVGEIEIN